MKVIDIHFCHHRSSLPAGGTENHTITLLTLSLHIGHSLFMIVCHLHDTCLHQILFFCKLSLQQLVIPQPIGEESACCVMDTVVKLCIAVHIHATKWLSWCLFFVFMSGGVALL